MSAADQGLIFFDKPAGTLSPAVTTRDFADSLLGREAAMKLDGSRTRFFLERAVVQDKSVRVEIVFEGQRLERIDLFFRMEGDNKGWEGWTQAAEQKRKETAEAWAREVFGKEMEIKPFELDGESMVPFEVTWETARHLKFRWGEVVSFFDSKAGFAGLGITSNPFTK